MPYSTISDIRRYLKRTAGSITISGSGAGSPGSMFKFSEAGSFIAEADGLIDSKCYRFYANDLPFTPVPGEVKWISERLATSYIITAAKQYTPDVTSEFLFDKQLLLYYQAMEKLKAIADGEDLIQGKVIAEPIKHSAVQTGELIFEDRKSVV